MAGNRSKKIVFDGIIELFFAEAVNTTITFSDTLYKNPILPNLNFKVSEKPIMLIWFYSY